MKELNIEAKVNNLNTVLSFVTDLLEEAGCSMKLQMQIEVAVEEIFVNIAHYAYTPNVGNATILAEVAGDPKALTVVFKDQGIPFNPLLREDPDVEAKAQDRSIGGLGIYMVKKSMDDMRYEYTDGYNILTIVKNIV